MSNSIASFLLQRRQAAAAREALYHADRLVKAGVRRLIWPSIKGPSVSTSVSVNKTLTVVDNRRKRTKSSKHRSENLLRKKVENKRWRQRWRAA
jgi:hypothetical protein